MNLSYFKFLFINTCRKKAVWLSFVVFLFTISAFLLIVPAIGKLNPLQAWAQPTMVVCQSFIGLIASVFCAILAVNIFKDTQEDGSDLIIISKPIKKNVVIFTKLILIFIFCLIANICSVLITCFVIFVPKFEIEYYWKLLLSLFIGNLISFTIFSSLAIFLTLKLTKIGIIISNVAVSLVFLIYQIIGVFVIPTPAKKLFTNNTVAHSYIVQNRNFSTGEYSEENLVYFENGFDNLIQNFTSWKNVKDYWENIKTSTPTDFLNFTDFASQLSNCYLSCLQDYSDRQGNRFFASSCRTYDYTLTSPASPEILDYGENKKSIPFVYYDNIKLKDENRGIYICWPYEYSICAIRSESESAVKGLSNKLPIGYLETKEWNSTSEVYFEPEDWIKYSKPFEIMFDHCFKYDLGVGKEDYYENNVSDPIYFNRIFSSNNNNINKMFEIIWACLTGHAGDEKYFGSKNPLKDFDKEYFNISTVKDLNERFLQFKYYSQLKCEQEQNALISNGYIWNESEFESTARQLAIADYKNILSEYFMNLEFVENTWLVKDKLINPLYINFLNQNTQTVSFTLLNYAWDYEVELMKSAGLREVDEKWIQNATNSALSKILSYGEIVRNFTEPKEKYLFVSLDNPERTTENKGSIFVYLFGWNNDYDTTIYKKGQNIQFFFYTTERKYNYWLFTIIWLGISLILTSGAVIVYNKYDIK